MIAEKYRSEWVTPRGYVMVQLSKRRVFKHVWLAELALGKHLPKGAVVHHINENKLDNSPENLIVLPNQTYHIMLHMRMKAMESCGNPDYRKCKFCKEFCPVSELKKSSERASRYFHTHCISADGLRRYHIRQAAKRAALINRS